MIVKLLDMVFGYLKSVLKNICKINPIEGGSKVVLRIYKSNVFQLDDGIGNFFGLVPSAGFDHAHWKTMEGDVEDVPSCTFKPGSQSAKLVVVFKEENGVTLLGQYIGPG